MPSFFASSSHHPATGLVAVERWALAVRAMIAHHDPGATLARQVVERFTDQVRTTLDGEDLGGVRQQIVTAIVATLDGAGAAIDDGLVFTLLVAGAREVRVFGLGPHRTYVASAVESRTVLAPHSLQEQVRRAGTAAPAPELALISTRIATRAVTARDLDAATVELPSEAWLVTQLDDRAPLLAPSALPRTSAEMLARLRANAQQVPNAMDAWLLAT